MNFVKILSVYVCRGLTFFLLGYVQVIELVEYVGQNSLLLE